MALSKEQQDNFDALNERLGFGPGEHSVFPTTGGEGEVLLSADPAKSAIPPKMIKVNTIQQLKELIGLPEEEDETIEHLLTSLPGDKAKTALTKKERYQVKLGALSLLTHKSEGLKSPGEDVINKTMFPLTLAAFSAVDYTVEPGKPLVIDDNTVHNYGTLTVEQNAFIEVTGSATLICQNLIQLGQSSSGTYTIKCTLPPIDPAQAESGGPGDTPTKKGAKGQDGKTCGSHCKTSPTNGGQGYGGGTGGNGSSGLNGANGPVFTCNASNIEGGITIYAGAQEGQKGGNGGVGGNGGPGGDPGNCPSQCSGKCASEGPQGNGGKGGDGGDGGDGGNGAKVVFYYGGPGTATPFFGSSNGGKGGDYGKGGAGFADGPHGDPGHNGDPGAPPTIDLKPTKAS